MTQPYDPNAKMGEVLLAKYKAELFPIEHAIDRALESHIRDKRR